ARVLVHDAARPMVDHGVISRVLAALQTSPGAVPALAVADTLKRGDGEMVETTVERAGLWRAQTPQGFRFDDILKAHRQAVGEELTDDAAVAERAGLAVAMVEGAEDNFKVTEADDLQRAERMIGGGDVRTGFGFDVHRFEDGDHVTLCGVAVAHDFALEGHSDADVGLHAVTDALLGAIGAGDIGAHFPPTDPQWKGAASDVFLRHAGELLSAQGGRISNLDVTLICEAPKIGPHREAMTNRISEILEISRDRVSVKATTTERLGFTGRGEGIAAQAVVTVVL
ncbi:MAG: 2-C-methyl-D-erythritol 2,4-cyclodiphosphate synthase, partial [Alphaproteobacteria bacterium]|nr:2-C-methyl-D-erythritol 2,4-cyclodiphosphate synthase [Alphaproteobacteria bacterium]